MRTKESVYENPIKGMALRIDAFGRQYIQIALYPVGKNPFELRVPVNSDTMNVYQHYCTGKRVELKGSIVSQTALFIFPWEQELEYFPVRFHGSIYIEGKERYELDAPFKDVGGLAYKMTPVDIQQDAYH